MSNTLRADKSFVKLLAILLVIYGAQVSGSHIAELLFEEEDAPSAVVAGQHMSTAHAAILPPIEDNSCHVEFTVLKRAAGRCVKLGKAMRACVSGTYIHPFHPDCM
jgi:hypothetical protein